MRRRFLQIFVWILPLSLASTLSAGISSRYSVVTLTASADAVVSGTSEATRIGGIINVKIQVERVLKGSVAEGSAVSLTLTLPERGGLPYGPAGTGAATRTESGHGIFFLQANPSGSWTLIPAAVGDIRWDDTYIPTPASVPQDLRNAAEASLPSNPSVLDHVLVEIVAAKEAGAPVPVDLVETFRENHSPVLTASFARFQAKQDAYLAATGLRGLIAAGDPSAILTVQRDYASLARTKFWGSLLQEIKIYYLNTDPAAIQTLGQIANDPNVGMDLRTAAAGTLARMHTQQTLPYLAKLLAEQNISLKTMAVGGLSSFANNVPIGSHEPAAGSWTYRTDDTIAHSAFDERIIAKQEAYYLNFWSDWWRQNESKLSQ